jgi:hypothetical protein
MSTRLAKRNSFDLIERTLIDKILAEQKYSVSGLVDVEQAAALGKLIGAQGIIVGTITEFKKAFQINARIINTETGEILSTSKVDIKKDYDTLSLASQIVPQKVAAVGKKEEVKTDPQPKTITEPKMEPKVETLTVKKSAEERIFYFENFSKVEDGDLPNDWLGGENLMVKTIERGKKVLMPYKSGDGKIIIEKVNFPQDWELQWVINSDEYYNLVCQVGNLKFRYGNQGVFVLDVSDVHGAYIYGSKIVKLSIIKKANKFCAEVDGNEVIFVRKNDFKPSNVISFDLGTNFKLYSIKGIDLTQESKEE